MIRPDISLEHLRTFVAVAEAGGVSAAARRLARPQSAVSYAIMRLEEQLGVSLVDRTAYRAGLTQAGHALLSQISALLRSADDLWAQAEGLSRGLESELVIAIDAMFPPDLLIPALQQLHGAFATLRVRLQAASLEAVHRLVVEGGADMGLAVAPDGAAPGLAQVSICKVELVCVAAPHHPLATLPGPLEPAQLEGWLQLVLSPEAQDEGPDRGVHGLQTWRLNDLSTKRAMLLAGAGWGSMPFHLVSDDLDQGRLVRLNPVRWDGPSGLPRLPMSLVWRADRGLGPGGTWLRDRLLRSGSLDDDRTFPSPSLNR